MAAEANKKPEKKEDEDEKSEEEEKKYEAPTFTTVANKTSY